MYGPLSRDGCVASFIAATEGNPPSNLGARTTRAEPRNPTGPTRTTHAGGVTRPGAPRREEWPEWDIRSARSGYSGRVSSPARIRPDARGAGIAIFVGVET